MACIRRFDIAQCSKYLAKMLRRAYSIYRAVLYLDNKRYDGGTDERNNGRIGSSMQILR